MVEVTQAQKDAAAAAKADAEARIAAAKETIKANAEARKAQQEAEVTSTPTPTQEEADLAKLGVPVTLADDGSGPEPKPVVTGQYMGPATTKQMESGNKPTQSYQTRAPSPPPAPKNSPDDFHYLAPLRFMPQGAHPV